MLVIAGESLIESYSRYVYSRQYNLKKLGKIELARDIGLYSYWLSEDPKIQKALKLLSSHVESHHDAIFDAEKFRDQLRESSKGEN